MNRTALDSSFNIHPSSFGSGLRTDRGRAALASADADGVVERQDEDLAVADLPRIAAARRVNDRLDRRLDERLVDGDLQLDLGQQPDLELRARGRPRSCRVAGRSRARR
jgi:hypothetical protein